MTQKIKQDGVIGANPILDGGISKNDINNSTLHTVPVGAIIAVDSSIEGVIVPTSGSVLNSYMLCDGSTIPKGHRINGNTPALTGEIFLKGSTLAGIGNINENNRVLDINQMPIHSHNSASNVTGNAGAANLNAGNQSNSHSHPAISTAHYHDTWFDSDMSVTPTNNNSYTWDFLLSRGYTNNTAITQVGGSGGSQTLNMANNNQAHTHAVNNRANHTHNVTGRSSDNTGNSSPIDIRPKYFSVQYVIKVS